MSNEQLSAEKIAKRTRESRAERLHKITKATATDTAERVECLRKQAFAWRNLSMIALVDAKKAGGLATMLLFNSVPYVNGQYLDDFNAKYADEAEAAGKAAGVLK